jgi:TolB-like protein/Tfp pilus assembly protein PilF
MSTVVVKACRKCGAKLFGEEKVCSACMLETALGPLLDDDVEPSTGLGTSLVSADRAKVKSPMMDFGDYELLEEIGRGGQGVVYRARQKSLNRTVALKVIGLGHFASTPHLRRFRQEAEAAARLEHSQIVPIYEINERDGSCYFSMKFIEGGQLDHSLKREPMSPRRAVELLVKIARTVQFAHEHGILHRDIKPGNILLDCHGEPHLTDFGLARLIENHSTVTNSFDVLGTPSYMAPEQAAGHAKELTASADLYSLGAVFYQMLTGEPPFAGGTTYETIRLVMENEPRNPRIRNPKVDVDLATICLKCLEKDPTKRYSSAAALAEDLERWLRNEPIQARTANVLTRTRKWIRRNPARAALIPSLIGLGALAIVFAWNREPAAPPTGIAVLPFEDLSDQKENASFADGIQDDILTKLAKIGRLRVISRTSVMQYRGEHNLRKIGQALRVSHVLEGSVRKIDNRIHVNAQLIETRTDNHVWADQYDGNSQDVFPLQSEIVGHIAEKLGTNISTGEKAAIRERPTKDLRAYELYCEAQGILIFGDPDGAEKSIAHKIQLLEEATRRDPNFALAYCAIAKSETDLIEDGDPRHLENARKALDTAAHIRPDLGEIHRELGRYYFFQEDYDRAAQELSIARRALPNDAELLRVSGQLERQRNNWDRALAEFEKAHQLDPRNGEILHHLFATYYVMRRYKEGHQLIDEAMANDPAYPGWIHLYSAGLKHREGDLSGARTTMAELPKDFSPAYEFWLLRFLIAYNLRQFEDAKQVIAETPSKYAAAVFWGPSPNTWWNGMIAHLEGNEPEAQRVWKVARETFEAMWANKPKDTDYYLRLSRIDCGLGRKEDAIREAKKSVELMPLTRNSFSGAAALTNLAMVYAWTGERDLAIEQLKIVSRIPAGVYYGELRFSPSWDPLRGDPRFEKIVADLKPELSSNEITTTNTAPENGIAPARSVAVLPFENVSKDEADAFLANGVQDEILRDLSKIADLKVINRTSVMKYKPGEKRDLREIAKLLGIAHVVEGTVQRAGERIRVSARLIDPRNVTPLWSDNYDRDVTDVFAVDDEIAERIADRLHANVSAAEKSAIEKRPTENNEAYQLYLKGRYFWNRRSVALPQTADDLTKANDYFQQAIAHDENYALAYAGLADCYTARPRYRGISPEEFTAKAKAAATKALQLDPNLGEAHTSLGQLLNSEGRYAEAKREFMRAIELSPNYATAHHWFALFTLTPAGRFDEAFAEMKRALELDPFSVIANSNLGWLYIMARKYPEAVAQLRKTIELEPTSVGTHWALAKALELDRQYDEAIVEYQKSETIGKQYALAHLVHLYAARGDRPKAFQTMQELQELERRGVVWNFGYAMAYAALGDKDKALDYLERSYGIKEIGSIFFIKVDPFLDPLRGNPRFEKLVNQVIPPDDK